MSNWFLHSYFTCVLLVFFSLSMKSMGVLGENHQIQNIFLNITTSEWKLKKYGKSEKHTIRKFLIKEIIWKAEWKYKIWDYSIFYKSTIFFIIHWRLNWTLVSKRQNSLISIFFFILIEVFCLKININMTWIKTSFSQSFAKFGILWSRPVTNIIASLFFILPTIDPK